jgi:hypothetical protein
VEDHHVDRPDVEARRRVKLTGTNRSIDLIALVAKARDSSVQSARALLNKTARKRGRAVALAHPEDA